MKFPKMMKIRQHFDAPVVKDIPAAVRTEVERLHLSGRLSPGDTVAVTVGSRGIANIALITKSLIDVLKSYGARTFVVPAMGSHGGATAEGQRAIVEGYGVTEDYIGAPIRATMEVVQVDTTEEGVPVYFDRFAYEADHVAVVGRVKPHTELTGAIQSGLHKMMLIGLGKYQGALHYHGAFIRHSFEQIARSVGQRVIRRCGILLGLGIVENQYDQTAILKAVAPEEFFEMETELLVQAHALLPKLPFPHIDLLVIDRMGKDISGSGLDTNVVGRKYHYKHAAEHEFPKITRIFVRDLTDASHGNATGIGIADFTHRRLERKMDYDLTYMNAITGNEPRAAALPICLDTDRRVLEAALSTVGCEDPAQAGIVRIHDTLHIREIIVSEKFEPELRGRTDIEIISPPADMVFDREDNLPDF